MDAFIENFIHHLVFLCIPSICELFYTILVKILAVSFINLIAKSLIF